MIPLRAQQKQEITPIKCNVHPSQDVIFLEISPQQNDPSPKMLFCALCPNPTQGILIKDIINSDSSTVFLNWLFHRFPQRGGVQTSASGSRSKGALPADNTPPEIFLEKLRTLISFERTSKPCETNRVSVLLEKLQTVILKKFKELKKHALVLANDADTKAKIMNEDYNKVSMKSELKGVFTENLEQQSTKSKEAKAYDIVKKVQFFLTQEKEDLVLSLKEQENRLNKIQDDSIIDRISQSLFDELSSLKLNFSKSDHLVAKQQEILSDESQYKQLWQKTQPQRNSFSAINLNLEKLTEDFEKKQRYLQEKQIYEQIASGQSNNTIKNINLQPILKQSQSYSNIIQNKETIKKQYSNVNERSTQQQVVSCKEPSYDFDVYPQNQEVEGCGEQPFKLKCTNYQCGKIAEIQGDGSFLIKDDLNYYRLKSFDCGTVCPVCKNKQRIKSLLVCYASFRGELLNCFTEYQQRFF